MGTDPSTWKWINVAVPGSFKGHASGPFELNSKIFDEIIANFKADGLPVPWDLEHASEADCTSGTIPTTGAPAQGWIHDLENRGPAGLWALTEWGAQAREYILSGKYLFCSPAVRFGSRDRVSGKPVGARLSSVALTNGPFLRSLEKLAAKDSGLERSVVSPDDYMPKVRGALKLHDLISPRQALKHLERLRHMVDQDGPEGVHNGVKLSEYTAPLRDLVSAKPGDTWEQVFDAVEDMIDATFPADIEEVQLNAGAEPVVAATDSGTAATIGEDMSAEHAVALKEAQAKVDAAALTLKDAESKILAAEGKVSELTLKLKDAESKVAVVEARAVAAEAEAVALREEKAKRHESDIVADVEIAYETYKDKKGLSESDKAHMLSFAKHSREAFNGMYPPVSVEQRHLLRKLTPPEVRVMTDPTELSLTALTHKLMSDEKLSYTEASAKAATMLSSATGAR